MISGNQDNTSPHPPPPLSSNPANETVTTVKVTLPFSCPFCPTSTSTSKSNFHAVPNAVITGHGILTILSSTSPWSWSVLRSCKYEDITPQDWALSMGETGGFRQMAWIPKPCGEVRVIGGSEEVRREGMVEIGIVTEVCSAWRQNTGEPMESRFAGMLSQLDAAVLSGEWAGR